MCTAATARVLVGFSATTVLSCKTQLCSCGVLSCSMLDGVCCLKTLQQQPAWQLAKNVACQVSTGLLCCTCMMVNLIDAFEAVTVWVPAGPGAVVLLPSPGQSRHSCVDCNAVHIGCVQVYIYA